MVVLSSAFRLFFLVAALLAMLAIPAWTLVATQNRSISSSLGAMGWHAHEMLFGYVGAVLAGFLLTATKNWTKRETLRPGLLAALLMLWVVGRVAVLQSGEGMILVSTLADAGFYLMVTLGIAIPIAGSRSKRNYAFPFLIFGIGLCDLAMHLHMRGVAPTHTARATYFAIDLIVIVVIIFGGRIVPMFTKGATDATPRAKSFLDPLGTWMMAGYALLHLLLPEQALTHVAAIVVGGVTCLRMIGWGGSHTLRKPILWVLHLAWFLVGVGVAMQGVVALTNFAPRGSFLHLLTIGGIGLMTLGMISRVSLGHTGRKLVVPKTVALGFLLVIVAAIARVAAPLVSPLHYERLLWIASGAWTLAFLPFLAYFAPILLSPRSDGKPG